MEDNNNNNFKFKVWHIPQVPGKAFETMTTTIKEAAIILQVLAYYDLFLLENNHRVDFANCQGVLYFDHNLNEWLDWEDDQGCSITELIDKGEFSGE